MATVREMLDMNMEEICEEAWRENWDMESLQAWSTFKIAQFIEKIAFSERKEAK